MTPFSAGAGFSLRARGPRGWAIRGSFSFRASFGDFRGLVPSPCLTHLAKLQNIPKEIYEAASIDGATWWTKFTRIEIPLIMSSIYLMLVFVIIGTIKDAGMIIALTGGMDGGPGGRATVPALFMLRKAFINQEMGAACAVGNYPDSGDHGVAETQLSRAGRKSERHWIRKALPPAVIAASVFLLFQPGWRAIGAFLFMVAFPYGAVRDLLRNRFSRAEQQDIRPVFRSRSRHSAPVNKAGEWSLRGFKHAAIWAVLGFALLPVYLILIVSMKTNQQFYEAPGRLTEPLHWHNWVDAWNLISSSVANSILHLDAGNRADIVLRSLRGVFFRQVARCHFQASSGMPCWCC